LVDLDYTVEASSEIWGGINTPDQAISGASEKDCWKSRPGIMYNVYEVNFEAISLNSFSVKWVTGFSASKYEVFVKSRGNFWKLVFTNIAEGSDEEDGGDGDEDNKFINMDT